MSKPSKLPTQRPGPPGGKRARNREERRQALLTAGLKVFLEKGVDAATIDDIIGEAAVAKGSFYRYFEGKADLLETAVRPIREVVAGLLRETLEAIAPARPDDDEVATRAYLHLGTELGMALMAHSDLARLYLQESRGAASEARAPIVALADTISAGAIAISERAESLGIQATECPVVSALTVVGTAEIMAHRLLTGRDIGGDPATVASGVVGIILDGIRPG